VPTIVETQQLGTYEAKHHSLNSVLEGINRLLHIGDGSIFDCDARIIPSIVALDLLFDDLPTSFCCSMDVTLKAGSALSTPGRNESFDGLLLAMLIHHLVGKILKGSVEYIRRAVGEAFRVLQPGERPITLKFYVPQRFYRLEGALFPLVAALINAILSHAAAPRCPASLHARMLKQHTTNLAVCRIPKGQCTLRFGYKIPSVVTPTNPCRFIAYKRYRPEVVR
jgi:hypothetical protein